MRRTFLVSIKIIFGAFSCQCWGLRRYLSFWCHTSLCRVPHLHLLLTFGAFLSCGVPKGQKSRKAGFTVHLEDKSFKNDSTQQGTLKILKTICGPYLNPTVINHPGVISSHMILVRLSL